METQVALNIEGVILNRKVKLDKLQKKVTKCDKIAETGINWIC